MKKIKPILPFFILIAFQIHATNDSLVRFSELNFKNSTEREYFIDIYNQNKKIDIINLMLMPYNKDYTSSSNKTHQAIDLFVAELQKDCINYSKAKKVKFVYKKVHEKFLKVYKLINSFSDIFEKGEYNCVSATALYAIVFDKMQIQFKIQEQPEHVYLTAYPDEENILIETTSPENGYLKLSPSMIQKYAKYLLNSKLITKQEFDNTPADTLFAKHYYSSSGIEFKHMPGVQYSNYSIYYSDEGRYELACDEIKKAYFIDQSQRNEYLLKNLLLHQMNDGNYQNEKHFKNLISLCRFNNKNDADVSNGFIKNEFLRLMNNLLIEKSDFEKTKNYFELIYATIKDSTLKQEINFSYHYELSRLSVLNKSNDVSKLTNFKIAYQINPKHNNLQGIIIANLIYEIGKNRQVENNLKLLDTYASLFDYLENNELYNNAKSNCLLELAYQYFSMKNISKGDVYIKQFEDLAAIKTELNANEIEIEKAYAEAASYFYSKGNNIKSKQYLNSGLKYAPNNFGLKMRLSQIR